MLEVADSINFLVIVIDNVFSWEKHVNKICKELASGIFILHCRKKIKMAYYGVTYTHLAHGIIVWGG